MADGEIIKWTELPKIEEIINEGARAIARQHRVNPAQFKIVLSLSLDGILKITAGNPVLITLRWPIADKTTLHMNLRSAINQVNKMFRTMEVVHVSLTLQTKENFRKYVKERYGDISEVIPDLIPRSRLRISEETITTLEDAQTGEKIEVRHKGKTTRFDGDDIGMWIKLSRIVREKETVNVLEVEPAPETQQTPELDIALSESENGNKS